MKKKKTLTQLNKILWEHCKRITRTRYMKQNGVWECFTCQRLIDEPSKAQTGHFLPSSTCGYYLRYDLRNLRIQCYNCNINCGGAGALFYKRLLETEGQEYIDQLFIDKNKIVKGYDHALHLIAEYGKFST